MKLSEHIYHIKEILSKGLPSDDFRLSNRHCYFIIKYIRAELIKQKLDTGRKVSPFNYQSIPCYKLEYKPITDCTCYTTDCKALQGVCNLPNIITDSSATSGLAIEGVWNIGLNQKYNYTSIDKLRNYKYTRTKKDSKTYFIHPNSTGQTLFVQDEPQLEVVFIKAIFEDPMVISELDCGACSKEDGSSCYDPLNDDFPMDASMVRVMYKMAYEELLGIMMKMPNDGSNNAQDINLNGK